MKVVFLDIDGVLNDASSRTRCGGYRGIDDGKTKNLAKIIQQTGAKIVLVSTWKEGWEKVYKERQGILANYLDGKMKKQGIAVFDKTQDYDTENALYLSRGEGILLYLSKNKVDKFVILDDCQFDYDGCGLTERYLKTNATKGGLTEELAQKAVGILNR